MANIPSPYCLIGNQVWLNTQVYPEYRTLKWTELQDLIAANPLPQGFRIPRISDYQTLEANMGTNAAIRATATDPVGTEFAWYDAYPTPTNALGLGCLPRGWRQYDGEYPNRMTGRACAFWTSSETSPGMRGVIYFCGMYGYNDQYLEGLNYSAWNIGGSGDVQAGDLMIVADLQDTEWYEDPNMCKTKLVVDALTELSTPIPMEFDNGIYLSNYEPAKYTIGVDTFAVVTPATIYKLQNDSLELLAVAASMHPNNPEGTTPVFDYNGFMVTSGADYFVVINCINQSGTIISSDLYYTENNFASITHCGTLTPSLSKLITTGYRKTIKLRDWVLYAAFNYYDYDEQVWKHSIQISTMMGQYWGEIGTSNFEITNIVYYNGEIYFNGENASIKCDSSYDLSESQYLYTSDERRTSNGDVYIKRMIIATGEYEWVRNNEVYITEYATEYTGMYPLANGLWDIGYIPYDSYECKENDYYPAAAYDGALLYVDFYRACESGPWGRSITWDLKNWGPDWTPYYMQYDEVYFDGGQGNPSEYDSGDTPKSIIYPLSNGQFYLLTGYFSEPAIKLYRFHIERCNASQLTLRLYVPIEGNWVKADMLYDASNRLASDVQVPDAGSWKTLMG